MFRSASFANLENFFKISFDPLVFVANQDTFHIDTDSFVAYDQNSPPSPTGVVLSYLSQSLLS